MVVTHALYFTNPQDGYVIISYLGTRYFIDETEDVRIPPRTLVNYNLPIIGEDPDEPVPVQEPTSEIATEAEPEQEHDVEAEQEPEQEHDIEAEPEPEQEHDIEAEPEPEPGIDIEPVRNRSRRLNP